MQEGIRGTAIDAAMIDKARWAQQEAVRGAAGGIANGPSPRPPGLTQIAEGLNERANSLHALVSELETMAARLLTDRSNKAAAAGGAAEALRSQTVEDRLYAASTSLGMLENRMHSLMQRLNEGI